MSNQPPKRPKPAVAIPPAPQEERRMIVCIVKDCPGITPEQIKSVLSQYGNIEQIRDAKGPGAFWVTFEDPATSSRLFRKHRDLELALPDGRPIQLHFEWSYKPLHPPSVSPSNTTVLNPYQSTTPATFPEPPPGASSSRLPTSGVEWDRSGRPIAPKPKGPSVTGGNPTTPLLPAHRPNSLPGPSKPTTVSGKPMISASTTSRPSTSQVDPSPPGPRVPSGSRKRTHSDALGVDTTSNSQLSSPPTPPHSPGHSPLPLNRSLPNPPSSDPSQRVSKIASSHPQKPESSVKKKMKLTNNLQKQLEAERNTRSAAIEGEAAATLRLQQATSSLESAERREKHLESALDKMTKEAEDTTERIVGLQRANQALMEQRDKSFATAEAKQAEIDSLRRTGEKQVNDLISQIESQTKRIASIDSQLQQLRDDNQASRAKTEAGHAKNLQLVLERDAARLEVQQTQDRLQRAQEELEAQRDNLKQMVDDRALALGEANRLESELKTSQSELDALKESLSSKDAEIDEERTKSADQATHISQLLQDLENLTITANDLQEMSTQAKKSHETEIVTMSRLQTKALEETYSIRAALEDSVFKLKHDLDEKENILQDAFGQLEEARKENLLTEKQFGELLLKIGALDPKKLGGIVPPVHRSAPSDVSLSSDPSAYERLSSFVEELHAKYNHAEDQVHEFSSQLTEARADIVRLQERVEHLDARLETQSAHLRSRSDELRIKSRELEAAVWKGKSLSGDYDNLRDRFSSTVGGLQEELENERHARLALEDAYMKLLEADPSRRDAGVQAAPDLPSRVNLAPPALVGTANPSSTSPNSHLTAQFNHLFLALREGNARARTLMPSSET